jgi:hypothetical protein
MRFRSLGEAWRDLSQARVKVGKQRGHLIIVEAARKGGHHSLARQHDVANFSVIRRGAAGQLPLTEETMQIRRRLLQREVVVFMTVGATPDVKLLPCRFLRTERRNRAACVEWQKCRRNER